MAWFTNLYLWIGIGSVGLLLSLGLAALLVWLARKTHAFVELKAHIRGIPICMFFDDNKTVVWRPIKPEGGIIYDKDFGSYIAGERGSYIDKRTRNIIIPFSANFAVAAGMKMYKITDDLVKLIRDENELDRVREALAFADADEIGYDLTTLKESVNLSSFKTFVNSILPHNITAKINLTIAQRLKNFGMINGQQTVIYTIMILGAIGLMALVLYLTVGGGHSGTAGSVVTSIGQGVSAAGSGVVTNSSVIAG